MSDGAHYRHDTNNSIAMVRSASTFGLELGELRKFVQLCDGMPDDASITFEDVDRSYTYVGGWTARVIKARGQRKAD